MGAESVQALIDAAQAAWRQAYAPYSAFRVGCCLEAADGTRFAGANVENAALPAGLCAEAAALGALVGSGQRAIAAVAVVAEAGFCPPCGTCRQRLAEFAWADTPVHMADRDGQVTTYRLATLLPLAFRADHWGDGAGAP